MISWLLNLQYLVAGLAALFVAVLAFAKRKPSLVSLSALALVELGLVAQLVTSVTLVVGGAKAKTDTFEFFGYLSVALLIPLAAVFWALVERNRWSTMVLAVAAATVGIMLARMQQIWLG